MNVLRFMVIVGILIAAASFTYRTLDDMRRRRRAHQLHTQTDREVADNCRPYGAHIEVAPRTDPTRNPVK